MGGESDDDNEGESQINNIGQITCFGMSIDKMKLKTCGSSYSWLMR